MWVWVVSVDHRIDGLDDIYSCTELLGIFSTEELARKWMERRRADADISKVLVDVHLQEIV